MLLDKFLPIYEFSEVHAVAVNAPPERVFAAIKEMRPSELSPVVNLLLGIRGLPSRAAGRRGYAITGDRPFLEQICQGGFMPLGEEPGSEVVLGMIGQFWKPVPLLATHLVGGEEFAALSHPEYAKVAANLTVCPGDTPGTTRCTTETRIHVPDSRARRRFAAYWRLIGMGSGLIRVAWLRAIKRRAEREP